MKARWNERQGWLFQLSRMSDGTTWVSFVDTDGFAHLVPSSEIRVETADLPQWDAPAEVPEPAKASA